MPRLRIKSILNLFTSAAHTKTSQESSLPNKLQCTRNRRSFLSHGNTKGIDFFFMCKVLLNVYLKFVSANRCRNGKHAEAILEALGVFVHDRDIPTRHTHSSSVLDSGNQHIFGIIEHSTGRNF